MSFVHFSWFVIRTYSFRVEVQYVDSQHRLPVTIFEWQHISQVQLTNMVDKPLDQYVFKGLIQFLFFFARGSPPVSDRLLLR
jgi:hypothetical protein